MDPYGEFKQECGENIKKQGADAELARTSREWMVRANGYKYSYNFEWLGRPIIQYPQDILAMQEILWRVRPDLVIETGVAHGGSLIFWASMLELNAVCGGPADAEVLGIDIDIRAHNRKAIESHPLFRRISLVQGSSLASETISQAVELARRKKRVLVSLDSNHTHEHVLAELEAYAPLVSTGSYCLVFDTVIEDFPAAMFPDRPWGPGNNPRTAVWKYLETHDEFQIDIEMQHKLLLTVSPDGYLLRTR